MVRIYFVRYWLLLCIIWYVCPSSFGQVWQILKNQPQGEIRSLEIDPLGNRYVISDDMSVVKYKPDGQVWYAYHNNRLGNIGTLDTGNPFKILVFYPQYQILVILDNTMSESGRLYFEDFGIGNVCAVAISDDNNIWIMEESNKSLVKVGTDGSVLLKGTPNYNLSLEANAPIFIHQRGKYLYVSQPEMPIQVFDVFGKWIKSIDLRPFEYPVYIDSHIYYVANDTVYSYNLELPEIDFREVCTCKDVHLIRLDPNGKRLIGVNKEGKLSFFNLESEK